MGRDRLVGEGTREGVGGLGKGRGNYNSKGLKLEGDTLSGPTNLRAEG